MDGFPYPTVKVTGWMEGWMGEVAGSFGTKPKKNLQKWIVKTAKYNHIDITMPRKQCSFDLRVPADVALEADLVDNYAEEADHEQHEEAEEKIEIV